MIYSFGGHSAHIYSFKLPGPTLLHVSLKHGDTAGILTMPRLGEPHEEFDGHCGNFNGIDSDDLLGSSERFCTSGGTVDPTVSLFIKGRGPIPVIDQQFDSKGS